MASYLRQLFNLCLPKNENRSAERFIDDLFFIVPPESLDRFSTIKPDGDYLCLRDFMLLFYFTKDLDCLQQPGQNYYRKKYFFEDGNRLFVIQGWISSVGDLKDSRDQLTTHESWTLLKPASFSVSEYSVYNSRLDSSLMRRNGLNPRVSSLNLPPLNNRHFLVASNDTLDSHFDVLADIEGLLDEPKNVEQSRERHVRPKAAKGARTKPSDVFKCDESKPNGPRLTRNSLFEPTRKLRPRQERPKAARGSRTQPNTMIQY